MKSIFISIVLPLLALSQGVCAKQNPVTSKVTVVVFVDDSGTMVPYLKQLDNISSVLFDSLNSRPCVDYRIGVVPLSHIGSTSLLIGQPAYLDHSDPLMREHFGERMNHRATDLKFEEPLNVMNQYLLVHSSELLDQEQVVFIFVGDSYDLTSKSRNPEIQAKLRNLSLHSKVSVYAITPPTQGSVECKVDCNLEAAGYQAACNFSSEPQEESMQKRISRLVKEGVVGDPEDVEKLVNSNAGHFTNFCKMDQYKTALEQIADDILLNSQCLISSL